MRSYEAARGLFSFISAVAWFLIAAGVIMAIFGFSEGWRINPRNPDVSRLIASIPGVLVGIIGFVTLAMSQMGRASVDTAEYTQQMLQLSREQLDVSRQSLRQSEQMKTSFEALRTAVADKPAADYASRLPPVERQPTPAKGQANPAIGYGGTTGKDAVTGQPSTTTLSATPLPSDPPVPSFSASRDKTT